jgi:LmbE family N-acetylglucosaminyl deacetylase
LTRIPLPPGSVESVRATSVLVLAPHYDDEVLGCGGLILQLVRAKAAVRVLFLTDSGGGRQPVDDRAAYRERRRSEAAAAAQALGIAGWDALAIPDGDLAGHLDEAAGGIERAILSQHPELVLAPSPLEVTADHRAAFAALHRALTGFRDEPNDPRTSLRVLLYEVNHPGHPDVLVDVSAEELQLEAAMRCYASQLERHPYWNAGEGLRRFRTLSLGPAVSLAEGYRRLKVEDFSTRSLSQLVGELGGEASPQEVTEGPLISVVVRTRDRPQLLAEALGSLAANGYRRTEVVLVNDGGVRPEVAKDFPFPIVRVDLETSRGRAGAAQAGIDAARGTWISFLDDDDLAGPDHLASLAAMTANTGARVVYSDAAVTTYELDAERGTWTCSERRLPYSRDFDPDVLLLDNYIPFNTLLIERELLSAAGPLDNSLPFFEDWDLLIRLAALAPFHHLARVTCEYRHFRGSGGHPHVFGEHPSERADFLAVKARVLERHAARLTPDLLARAVDRLRREAVSEHEERRTVRAELVRTQADLGGLLQAHDALSRERFALEDRFHALNGELQALRTAHEELRLRYRADVESLHHQAQARDAELSKVTTETQRLYHEEIKLRSMIEEQGQHLGRTYGEIERLSRLLDAMRATRAWRAHEWLHRRSPAK